MLETSHREVLGAASSWIEREIGLHFPPQQWRDLERGLDAAAARLGMDDALSCAQWLLQGNPGAHGREVLAECLGIRETYFFRDPPLFALLAEEVLAPLIESRRGATRCLRLWSAGCATGEEPYSLAMLVASLLPQWREWNISILATDLNEAALERARAGRYGPWSVRGGIPESAAAYLMPCAGGRYEVHEDIRRLVRFEPLNLVDGGALPAAADAMDLVVCRNVLMYFAPQRRAAVLRRLGDSLAEGGWLVTNPVEIPVGGVAGMTVAVSRAGVALRRGVAQVRQPCAGAAAPGRQCIAARAESAPAAARSALARPRPLPSATAGPLPSADAAATVGEREAACRRAMEEDRLDPQWPYLLACLLSERGADDEAAVALRRTLYLAPDHVLAHIGLGSIAARAGRRAAGRRHFDAALARLSGWGPDEVVPGSGGMAARALARLVVTFREAG